MTAAATPAKSSAKTHREHGRCLNCGVPYNVNVRQGYYVKCPKCGAVNPGSLMSATIAKANTKPKPPTATKPAGQERDPRAVTTPPSPAPPRKPKVQLAKPKLPPKPAPASGPTSAPPAPPPAPATPPKRGFFSRLMGEDDD